MSQDSSGHFDLKKLSWIGVLVSLGIVFGDIGTSPLYVMKAIINAGKSRRNYLRRIYRRCIVLHHLDTDFTTTIKYVIIALRADNKGEGGILSLYSLVKRFKKKWLYIIAIIGAAALVADSIITPSLTVMSAIEGLELVMHKPPVVPITLTILVIIFVVQQFGTSFIGKFLDLLWFFGFWFWADSVLFI
jgi:KUP system potassium uptake protein